MVKAGCLTGRVCGGGGLSVEVLECRYRFSGIGGEHSLLLSGIKFAEVGGDEVGVKCLQGILFVLKK